MNGRNDEVEVEDVLARLEAMAARLDEQDAEIARLRAMAATTVSAPEASAAPASKVGRRAMLTKVVGATAAAAVLTVAKEATTAEAATRTTVLAGDGSNANVGLMAVPGGDDPAAFVPGPINAHGVIGGLRVPLPTAPLASGVLGLANTTVGVEGVTNSGYGVYGLSSSGPGMFAGSGSNIGLYANSVQSTGVFATAPVQAVWGRTTAGVGVFGQATATNGIGVYGAAPAAANTWAGYFEGNVFVTGRVFTAAGGILSASRQSDGSMRVLHSQDSTEPVIEAFGRGTLTAGRAVVDVDPDVAAASPGADYLVFVTEESEKGEAGGLYVAARQQGRFEVRARSGSGSGTFAYRVVARLKATSRGPSARPADSTAVKPQRRVDQPAPSLPTVDPKER